MNRLGFRSIVVMFGLAMSFSAYGQGGFGGGGGGFGGGAGGAGGGFGGGAGGAGGAGGDQGAPEVESVEGNWQLEFEVEFDSQNADIERDRIRVRADVSQLGQELTGRLRGDGEGQFTCTLIEGSGFCENGRLQIIWDEETEQKIGTLEFTIDQIDGRRGEGEATFTDTQTGRIIQYSIDMRKR